MTDQKFGLTEGILLASVPVIGYWCAFLYELGYCFYFDIPSFFVEVGLISVMPAILGLLTVIVFIYFIAESIFMTPFRGLPASLKSIFRRIAYIASFIVGYGIIMRYAFSMVVSLVILVIAIFCLFQFVSPLITQHKTKGYLAKLDAAHKDYLRYDTLLDIGVQKIGRTLFIFFFSIYLLSILAFFSGGCRARFQDNFIVLSGTPELVVLKKYDSYFIVAVLNRSSKSFSAEYKLLPVDKDLSLFKLERVGPLTCVSKKIDN